MSGFSDVSAVEQGGELWLNAQQLIAHLRARAARWDQMATEPDGDYPAEVYQTACWAAVAALDNEADALDLECLARVNEERTST